MTVEWRDAVRGDRVALQQFRCTTPQPRGPGGRPLPHPRPWEFEVHKWIHTLDGPGGPEDLIRLGFETDHAGVAQLVAVAVTHELSDDDGSMFKIRALAIDHDHRGHGGALAQDCLMDTLDQIAARARALGDDEVVVIGYVDRRNNASQHMLHGKDFEHVGKIDEDLQEWARVVDLSVSE